MRLTAEQVGRAEFHRDKPQGRSGPLYLNRLRIATTVQPRPWLRFFFEAQDARAVATRAEEAALATSRNPLDLRAGYVEVGASSEAGFQMRFGRQAIAIGDERLVGADSYWDPFGQAFDAVRLSYARGQFRAEAFAGFLVETARRRPDPFDSASRIGGIVVHLPPQGGSHSLEPYLLWKRGGDTRNLLEQPGHRDVLTPGIRAFGDGPAALDYNVEIALQRGHVVTDSISAWAGHWEIGWKPLGRDLGPRIGLEYNYASGDSYPEDGRHHTFDDLYPAGFNKYGIVDPYAWRNLRSPSLGVDMPVTRSWAFYGGYRAYWLATVQDGLYPGGDDFVVRNPDAPSPHIGNQAFLSATYTHSERWHISAGYGHLFPGSYLRRSTCASALHSLYLLSNLRF
jgi:hypothetical protein